MTRPPGVPAARKAVATAAMMMLAALVSGCNQSAQVADLHDRLAETESRAEKLQRENADLQAQLRRLREQTDTLQQLGDKRLEKLYTVASIDLGSHTGGIDLDDEPADHEGIKVFLEPVDTHGDVLKAAGSVKVQLYDLAADQTDNLIGGYTWSVDELAEKWSSGFLAYHYSLECPWGDRPPAHDEVTVRVEFTEYLTGETFTAQTVCKVRLPE
jgi:hypothetical protein